MNIAENGQPFKDQEDYSGVHPRNYESDIELTYRAPINDWLAVQPDVQYTINPGSNPLLKNDLIIGLRLEFGYNVGFDSLQNQTPSMAQHP